MSARNVLVRIHVGVGKNQIIFVGRETRVDALHASQERSNYILEISLVQNAL